MFNMIMEKNTNEGNITFIELQTIKEDLIFENESKTEMKEINYDESNVSAEIINPEQPEADIERNEANQNNKSDSDSSELIIRRICKSKTKKRRKAKVDIKMSKFKKKNYKGWTSKKKNNTKNLKKKKKYLKSSKVPKSSKQVTKKPKCEYPRLCSGCGHAYKTKQSFWNHKQRCAMLPQNSMRNNAVDENGLPIGDGEGNIEFVRRKEYICAHCERHYRKKYNLQEHLKNTCRGKPCSKGRLLCWEEGCAQAFYKYVDLVQHVTLQHGHDLQIQKLQFPNFSAFNSWKTEESNSKFMYARKITGSKRFSNTKYHYFVCQFNHRNEKKNSNRKTNRRKSVNLVVPNYNCPSRIMVKECENQILVTYISSHNHELNLANVKYQPLEKETRAYIKTLLQLGVSAKKIKEHLQEGVGNPEIDSFLSTKQHFLTLNRIKRMESKLKAKNRARLLELANQEKNNTVNTDNDSVTHDDSFSPCEERIDTTATSSNCVQNPKTGRKNNDEVVRSIDSNLKKLRSYMHKASIKEKLSDRVSKMIQELCDECEHMESNVSFDRLTQKKPRAQNAGRKQKLATIVPQPQLQLEPTAMSQQPVLQPHPSTNQQMGTYEQSRIVNNVVNSVIRNEKSFTPVIDERTDLLKPIFQPFNVNLLCLKSVDMYISNRELHLLKSMDESFTLGWLCDAVVDSFMNIICQPLSNVLAADTGITQYVQTQQKVPDVWHCFNWNDIDTIFIPCNPSKKHWFLLVLLVKQSELQILDPACSYETISNIYKKYATSINCWYNVLRNFLGILQCNVTSPSHAKQNDPSNCGVLVCWYVFQYINKRSLIDNIDPDIFRKYIYNTIVSSSTPAE